MESERSVEAKMQRIMPDGERVTSVLPFSPPRAQWQLLQAAQLFHGGAMDLPEDVLKERIGMTLELLEGLNNGSAQLPLLDMQIVSAHQVTLDAFNRCAGSSSLETRKAEAEIASKLGRTLVCLMAFRSELESRLKDADVVDGEGESCARKAV